MEIIGVLVFLQLLVRIVISIPEQSISPIPRNLPENPPESIKFIPQSSFTHSDFNDGQLETVSKNKNYSGSFSVSSIFSSHRPYNKYYKSYKSMQLFGEKNSIGSSNRGRSGLVDGDVLQLGQINEPFRGPRRRRRNLDGDKYTTSGSKVTKHSRTNTYIVYSQKIDPEKQHSATTMERDQINRVNQTENHSSLSPHIQLMPVYVNSHKPLDHRGMNLTPIPMPTPRKDIVLSEKQYSEPIKDVYLDKAIGEAWVQYGIPKVSTTGHQSPDEMLKYQNNGNYFGANNSFNFGSPSESNWNHQYYTQMPNNNLQSPGPFNRVLSTYVDYELNHPATTTWVKTIAYGLFISSVIVGWVLIGYALGLIPQSIFSFWKTGNSIKEPNRRSSENSVLQNISTHVALALEGDWLKKLEETVRTGATGGKWIKTHVSCCILPDSKTNGMAECEIVRKSRKMSTFQCLSNLIYNFSFGPIDKPRF